MVELVTRSIRPRTQAEAAAIVERNAAIAEYRSRRKLQNALRRAEKAARRHQLQSDEPAEAQFSFVEFARIWNAPQIQQVLIGVTREAEERLRDLLMSVLRGHAPLSSWTLTVRALAADKRQSEPPAGYAPGRSRRAYRGY
jgi:hypothetical protein